MAKRRHDPSAPAELQASAWVPLSWAHLAVLCGVVALVLLPQINKAYHVDDPLFVWTAKQVLHDPLNFYGFFTNWGKTQTYMYEIMQNPPLISYYLAPFGAALGWGEPVMHLAMLLLTIFSCAGIYMAARRFCSRPALAAALVFVCPGFLVSAAQVMSDVPMVGWWGWALYFWMRGIDEDKVPLSVIGALCIGIGALTKYFAFSLAPLLLVYTLMATPARRNHLWALLISFFILIGFEFLCNRLYGIGLLSDATRFASQHRAQYSADPVKKMQIALVFAGGAIASVTLLMPWLWRRAELIAWGVLFLLVLGINYMLPDGTRVLGKVLLINMDQPGQAVVSESATSPTFLHHLQWTLWTVGGLQCIALSIGDLLRRRDAASVMFALWIAGTFFFVTMINHFVNARVLLPIGLAVALLAVRKMEDLSGEARWTPGEWRLPTPWLHRGAWGVVGATLIMTIALSYLDYRLAGSSREAAKTIMAQAAGRTVWFSGHSGWQYYMEELGGKPIDEKRSTGLPGDLYVLPSNNWQPIPVSPFRAGPDHTLDFPVPHWGTTSHYQFYAGFYSDGAGPLPFYFGPVVDESYLIVELVEIREQ